MNYQTAIASLQTANPTLWASLPAKRKSEMTIEKVQYIVNTRNHYAQQEYKELSIEPDYCSEDFTCKVDRQEHVNETLIRYYS